MASSGWVRQWQEDEGWGVVECVDTPGGCWFHYSDLMAERPGPPSVGQAVSLRFERAEQDGYHYRATEVWPAEQQAPSYRNVVTVTSPSSGFSSTLGFRFGVDGDHARRTGEVGIEQVDERDNSWEDHHPRFRVYLHSSGDTETWGSTDTYDVTGADLAQVVEWAQRQAGAVMTYAIALVVDDEAKEARSPGHGRGLVWLIGMDGNDPPWDDEDVLTRRTQERMLLRRAAPIQVADIDRMPDGVPDPYNDGTEQR